MSDFQDLDIRRTPELHDRRAPSRRGVLIAAALLAVAVAAAVYVAFFRGQPADERVTVAESEVAAPARPLGGDAEAIDVPPLDETDPLVRQLAAGLSSHPTLAAWLATDNLIRSFVVVADTIAAQGTPARNLDVVKPSRPFAVADRGEQTVIDPRSYARYDAIAEAFGSLDPEGTARVYATLRPRLDQAYQERFVGGTFDSRLERAIVVLLDTPVPPEEIAVEPRGVGYAFADPALEQRPAAQKQLLRMGPRNVRIVKARLREIALALGIPAERLPKEG